MKYDIWWRICKEELMVTSCHQQWHDFYQCWRNKVTFGTLCFNMVKMNIITHWTYSKVRIMSFGSMTTNMRISNDLPLMWRVAAWQLLKFTGSVRFSCHSQLKQLRFLIHFSFSNIFQRLHSCRTIFLFPVAHDAALSFSSSRPSSLQQAPPSPLSAPSHIKTQDEGLIHPTPGHNRPQHRKTIMNR